MRRGVETNLRGIWTANAGTEVADRLMALDNDAITCRTRRGSGGIFPRSLFVDYALDGVPQIPAARPSAVQFSRPHQVLHPARVGHGLGLLHDNFSPTFWQRWIDNFAATYRQTGFAW